MGRALTLKSRIGQRLGAGLAFAALAGASLAHAEPVHARHEPDSLDASPSSNSALDTRGRESDEAKADRLRRARERLQRAVKLYDEGAFELALLEFRRAYELAPTYRLLYNLALVSTDLHDYARAAQYFERYLAEGGTSITPERRSAVQATLVELNLHTILVYVRVNVAGAQIFVDDQLVGASPLADALRLNAGFRRISARSAGRFPDARALQLAGGETATVELTLSTAAAEPHPTPVEPASRPIPWLAWSGTAVLGAAAIYSGARALAEDHHYERLRGELGITRSSLERVDHNATRWSVTADVLGLSALGLGLYSAYLTWLAPEAQQSRAATTLRIDVIGRSAELRLAF